MEVSQEFWRTNPAVWFRQLETRSTLNATGFTYAFVGLNEEPIELNLHYTQELEEFIKYLSVS